MTISIKTKVLIGFIGIVFLVTILLSIPFYLLRDNFIYEYQRENLEFYASTAAKHVQKSIEFHKDSFERFATNEVIEVYSKKYDDSMLGEYFSKNSSLKMAGFVNEQGFELFKTINGIESENLLDVNQSPVFKMAIINPGRTVSSNLIMDKDNNPVMRFGYCNIDFFDNLIGVIIGEISLTEFTNQLKDYKIGNTGFTLLVGHDLKILFHPQQNYLLKNLSLSGNNAESFINGLTSVNIGSERITIQGIDSLTAYAPVAHTEWTVLVIYPFEEYFDKEKIVLWIVFGIFLACIIFAVVVAYQLGSRITGPLSKISLHMEEVAKGRRVDRIILKSNDEIENLAESFNSMTDDLKTFRYELEQQREWLEVIISSIGEGIIATDNSGGVTFLNPMAEQLTGWKNEESLGRNIKDIFRFADPDEGAFEGNGEQGEPKYFDAPILLSCSGKAIPIEFSEAPIKGKDDQILGEIIVFHDITTRLNAEKEQYKLQEQLRQAQKMEAVGTMAGGIAHDLNSLLGIITGYGFMLKKKVKEDLQATQFLEEIVKAGRRAKELIIRMNSFARPSIENKNVIDLYNVIYEAISLLRATLPTSIEVFLHQEDRDCFILGDEPQIMQVMTNLFINAGHAITNEKGYISITIKRLEIKRDVALINQVLPGEYIRLKISDTGEGISPENLEKVFDPFFTTKSTGKNSGLGLSVVYGIVKGHDGFITVDSILGKMTTFEIYFPSMNNV